MKYRVCVVTGTRADYGLLRELLFRIRDNDRMDLDLMVTGSHLSSSFGNTQNEIIQDGFTFTAMPIPIEMDSQSDIGRATGRAIIGFTDCFEYSRPDIVVVLGDRYEILSVVIAARMQDIPVAHISGGDVTEGAIDDAIRHSITKMSQIHFPGCEQSRKRIIQMGENPDTVFNVGEPGVENCLKTRFIEREALAGELGFPGIKNDYAMVTFHPVTLEEGTGLQQVRELISAMDCFPELHFIVTLANADAGGRAINSLWHEAGESRTNWLVKSSLGMVRYLSAVKSSKLVIGNSSSGIVEAPALGVPTVNIGDRQKGRMLSDSIICCKPETGDIVNAIQKALAMDFQEGAKRTVSLFGTGDTSALIEKHILQFLENYKGSNKKTFYDIEF